jgi:predicted dehydrogenase
MPEKYNIAVIGTGMWGKTHISMFQEDSRATITWIYDLNPDIAKAAQEKFGVKQVAKDIREILDDPAVDAVVVASPPSSHVPIALDVLRAGKHLVVEKPMAVNREEAAALVAEAASHPELVALEGSCRHTRLNPKFRFVKSLIESGKLGRIYHIHHNHLGQGTFVEYNPNGAWAMDKRYAGGGPLMDWGEYDLSFHLGVLGDRPQLQAVHAFTITGLRDLSKLAPVVNIEMHGAAYMEFSEGLTYYYERGAGVHGETRNETRLYGTKGGLHFSYTTWESNTIEYFHAEEEPEKESLVVDMSKHPSHDNIAFVSHFLDCLEGKAQPLMPVSLAAKHLNIVFNLLKY